MLFHEVYGSYFNAVAAVLARAVQGTLTDRTLGELVRERAFAESVLTLPAALRSGAWPLLTPSCETPLRAAPTMPLTTLQKRWLKTLLQDPRIQLFSPPAQGLEEVEPLGPPDAFLYFDRYADGDPYSDAGYIERFKTILAALRDRRELCIAFEGHSGRRHRWVCTPSRLEYSPKDDKFRLITAGPEGPRPINLARMRACELLGPQTAGTAAQWYRRETLVLELTDERNALERAMLDFSHLEKRTERIGPDRYRVTLHYEREEAAEMLIRVLAFGPMMQVVSPESFVAQLRARIEKQLQLRA